MIGKRFKVWFIGMVVAGGFVTFALAQGSGQKLDDGMSGGSLLKQDSIPEMAQQDQQETRRARSLPMKAPTIPHLIEGFQVTRQFNQCLVCHGQEASLALRAPAVPVSHYLDRDGKYLADISPRRYFCTQCHVPLTTAIMPGTLHP